MYLSKFDLMDRFSAFQWEHKTTHKEGHEITYNAIAIDDISQVLDEIMNEGKIIQIVDRVEKLKSDISQIENEIENKEIKLKRLKKHLSCL